MTRARQMLSFPLGVFVSYYKEEFIRTIENRVFLVISIAIGLGMMLITNTSFAKNMSFLPQNIMSLFTVLPLAIVVIGASVYYRKHLNLGVFYTMGIYSFEMYLVEYFVRKLLVIDSFWKLIILIPITISISWLLHFINSKFDLSGILKGK